MGSSVKRKRKAKKSDAEVQAHQAFVEAAARQRCCQMCGKTGTYWHPHHVVYEQHLKGAGQPVYDERNVMRLCIDCHASHHNRSKVIPLTKLSDTHIEYAFVALGLGAEFYLEQRYEGEDERVQAQAAKLEGSEHGGSASPAVPC